MQAERRRRSKRRPPAHPGDSVKLVHDGSNSATLTLAAGETYTLEAVATSGDFTLSIAPQ